jgi:hypothetical protein
MRYIALIALVFALAGCAGTTTTHHVAAAASTTAPRSEAPSASAASEASCAAQVAEWLATPDDSGFAANTVQHDIDAVLSGAQDYLLFHNPSASDPNAGPSAGQFFLTHMTDSNYQGIVPMAIPSCADPSGDWRTFLSDVQTASDETTGTSEAQQAVLLVETDFTVLNAELMTTALGVQIQAPPGYRPG